MITSINTTGSYTYVSGGYMPVPSIPSSPYPSQGPDVSGMVRWNIVQSRMEVYDGHSWVTLGSSATVGLTPEATGILDWARKKMQEEEQIEKLVATHPGIRDLKDKLDVMIALVRKEQNDSQ